VAGESLWQEKESRLGMTYAEQFAARYAAGATVREIANEARLSHSYVLRHLHAMGVPMR
jgi:hypothetical protein